MARLDALAVKTAVASERPPMHPSQKLIHDFHVLQGRVYAGEADADAVGLPNQFTNPRQMFETMPQA